jgi:hypothetical protein
MFGILVVAGVVALEILVGRLVGWVAPSLSILGIGVVTGGFLGLLLAASIWRSGDAHELGLAGWPRLRSVAWYAPFLIYGLLPLTGGVRSAPADIALGAVAGVLIAFWKLTVLALLLRAYSRRGAWGATTLAAVLFAIMHLGGLAVGAALAPTLVLSVSYLFLAFGLGGVRIRTGYMWPLMVCYAVLLTTAAAGQGASSPNFAPSVESILPAVVIGVVLAACGAFALYSSDAGRQRALERP